MAFHGKPVSAFLVVRVWRSPDGDLCTRVGAVTHSDSDLPNWSACLGIDQTLGRVRTWLERWSDDPDLTAEGTPVPASTGTENPN
jgi:hypothetical protein